MLERTSTYSVGLRATARSPAKTAGSQYPSNGGAASTSGSGATAATIIGYALGILACVLLFAHTYNERTRDTTGMAMMGKRGLKQMDPTRSKLESELQQREEEVRVLQEQMDKLLSRNQITEVNMEAQEAMIGKLQQRAETEKTARNKAQRALADRSTSLTACQSQQRVLEREVVQCTRDLHNLRNGASVDTQQEQRSLQRGQRDGSDTF